MTTRTTRVGLIGLGIMGLPMAKNLLKAGFDLTVYNRSRGPTHEIESLGGVAVDSPRAVAERSKIVITMVTDAEAVEAVILGPSGVIEGAAPGSIVVDMSTISPAVTRMIASTLSSRGVDMLDAPVSGGDRGAKEASLTIMVGGPAAAFERCTPVFAALGKKVVHMGGAGTGQLTKLANQILAACNMIGVSECLLFAERSGLDPGKVIDSLSAGAAASWSLTNLGPKVASRDFAPGFKLKLLQKDLRYVLEEAEHADVALPATRLVHGLYRELESENRGEQGTQALVDALARLTSKPQQKDGQC